MRCSFESIQRDKMKLYLFYLFSLLSFPGLTQVEIQNYVFASAGSNISSSSYSFEYTIGEPVTQYISEPNNIISQGFNQPLRKKEFFDLEPLENVSLEQLQNTDIRVFPNPFNSTISIVHNHSGILNAEIIDISGRLVFTINLTATSTELFLEHLSSGMYHLILSDGLTINARVNIIKTI